MCSAMLGLGLGNLSYSQIDTLEQMHRDGLSRWVFYFVLYLILPIEGEENPVKGAGMLQMRPD